MSAVRDAGGCGRCMRNARFLRARGEKRKDIILPDFFKASALRFRPQDVRPLFVVMLAPSTCPTCGDYASSPSRIGSKCIYKILSTRAPFRD